MSTTSTITLKVKDASDMNAYVVTPQGNGPFPAVIVFQEAFGVTDHIKDVADRIAAEGYLAVAPELFHRTAAPGEALSYDDFSKVAPHTKALTTEGLIADTEAVYNWLMEQPGVLHDKIGTIGFCLGGRVSFLANSAVKLACAVSFYSGNMPAVLDRVKDLQAPQLFFWGGKDQHIKAEHINMVTEAMNQEDKEYMNVVISYADHGFFRDVDARHYEPKASAEAWALTKAFFGSNLGR